MSQPHRTSRFFARRLGRRIGLNLFVCAAFGLIAILALLGLVIDARFDRLEQQNIHGHVERAQAMLQSMEEAARGQALDWSIWDESFDYILTPNRTYEEANLNLSSMRNIETAATSLVRFDDRFKKTVYFDLSTGRLDQASRVAFERQVASPVFAAEMRRRQIRSGFIHIGDRLLVFAAAQIFRSDATDRPEGYLVMGKEINSRDAIHALQLPAQILFGEAVHSPALLRSFETILITHRVTGGDGQPVAAIRFSVPRTLRKEGFALLMFTGAVVASLLMALILLLNWRLRTILIRPVQAIQGHVAEIARSGRLLAFDDKGRPDELGDLCREFNRMTGELHALRAKVEAQSFAIGRSESAADIMHNVRNAISPVQAILGKLDQRLRFPAEANVKLALAELAQPGSEERRGDLAGFVRAAVDKVMADLAQHRADVREALCSLLQVDEAISVERGVARLGEVAVDCDLTSVVGTSSAIARHNPLAQVSVTFDPGERFRIAVPRVLLAQVIDNLLTNAVEAIAATGRGRGTIMIDVVPDAEAPSRFVYVAIQDDGDGFSSEKVAQFFERGHSGRGKTRGGIGLHWCANTLNAYGGALAFTATERGGERPPQSIYP